MSTIDPTQLPNIIFERGYAALADKYTPDQQYFRRFCSEIPHASLLDAPYGQRWAGSVLDATPKRRADHEESEGSTGGEGYPRQIASIEYSRRFEVPAAMLQAPNADAVIGARAQKWFETFARDRMISQDEHVAGMLQKGTLSAGSAAYFNQSYPNTQDPYPKYIYDGKPFFAASGNGHPTKFSSSTYVNLTVSNALNAANLNSTLVTMRTTNAVDERGKRILIAPKFLIVPPDLEATADVVLNSTQLPGTGQNDRNYNFGKLAIISNPFLTDDATAWWVADPAYGLVYTETPTAIQNYYDEKTKTFGFEASYRFGVAVEDWRGWYCNDKAAS